MDVLIGVVIRSEVGTNRGGEVPGRLLQVVISEPTDAQTVELMQGGDEFNPPRGTRAVLADAGDCLVALGTDDGIPPAMDPGGRRIYSLSPDGMEVMAEVQLKPDGTVTVSNAAVTQTWAPDGSVTTANESGSFTLHPDGKFTFHGTGSTFDHDVTVQGKITASDTITAPTVAGTTDVTFAGISAKGHKHVSNIAGLFTGTPV